MLKNLKNENWFRSEKKAFFPVSQGLSFILKKNKLAKTYRTQPLKSSFDTSI